MLDALLETIGTLGILAGLAAKSGKPSADAMACDIAGRDRLHAAVPAFPSMRSNRSPAECAHGKRHDCKDEQAMDHDEPCGNPSVRFGALSKRRERPHMADSVEKLCSNICRLSQEADQVSERS
jgi:NAD(P)H-hydrate repair Nnr-like enzyme with NAD(P)H-hydrate dehydratase domain